MQPLRINNLSFRECSYLGNKPEIPSWEIVYWMPNPDYKQEDKYKQDRDSYIRYMEGIPIRKHKSCFKNKEYCFTIAVFYYKSCWELQFIADRPLSLNEKERKDFWTLIEYGYKELNKECCLKNN